MITYEEYTEPDPDGRDEEAISEFLCDCGQLKPRIFPDDFFSLITFV
jgi:hypothetical protein